MNPKQTKTISKSLRIPEPVFRDIEQAATRNNTTFTDIANYRLQHHENPITPALLAKLQNIANLATEAVTESSTTKAETVQKEVASLWKSLK